LTDTAAQTLSLRQRFLGAGFWLGGSQTLLGILGIGVTVILARLLVPEDYGLVAMATIFVGLLHQTSNVGLGHAFVRKAVVTRETEALTFSYALVYTLFLYSLIFLAAPLVAAFYGEPRVTALLRFMALGFIIRSFYIVPNSLMRRSFRMKQQAAVQAVSVVTDAVVTICLALAGFGPWALATGPIVGQIVLAIGASIVQPWYLALRFRSRETRELITFAGGVNASILLWYWYVSSDTLIVGHALGGAALGIYTMAMNLSKLTWNRLWLILNPILLPLFSEARREPGELGRLFLRVTHFMALIIFPAAAGLAVVAQEAVPVALSDKWGAVVAPLRWLCLLGMARCLVVIMSPVILALGRVRIELVFNLVCGIFLPLSFLAGLRIGVVGVAAAWAIVFPLLAMVFELRPVLTELGFSLRKYMGALASPAIGTLFMVAAVVGLGMVLDVPRSWLMVIKILVGVATYVGVTTIIEGNPYAEFRRFLRDTRAGARA
jgi:O-antigen/teichoic acid export membrane protein